MESNLTDAEGSRSSWSKSCSKPAITIIVVHGNHTAAGPFQRVLAGKVVPKFIHAASVQVGREAHRLEPTVAGDRASSISMQADSCCYLV